MRALIDFPVDLAMFVAGCETYYKNPKSTPIARVRFVAASPDQKFTVTHYDANCGFGAGGGVMGTGISARVIRMGGFVVGNS